MSTITAKIGEGGGGGRNGLELLSKVVDGASGGDLILPDSVDECHIFNDLSQAAVAL